MQGRIFQRGGKYFNVTNSATVILYFTNFKQDFNRRPLYYTAPTRSVQMNFEGVVCCRHYINFVVVVLLAFHSLVLSLVPSFVICCCCCTESNVAVNTKFLQITEN